MKDVVAEAAKKGLRVDESRRSALEAILLSNAQVMSRLEPYSREETPDSSRDVSRTPSPPRMGQLSELPTHTDQVAGSSNRKPAPDGRFSPSSVRAFTHVFDAPLRCGQSEVSDVGTAALKDMIAVRGHANTVGTSVFGTRASAQNAEVTDKLLESNWSIVGMTNMHALAFGTTGLGSEMGPAVNALHDDVLPGGSSSGSAVAVAAGDVDTAIGTDTGGSVRIPAALNGIVGFKPTFGRVSTKGVVPLAPSLDHVGTFGRDVSAAAGAFAAIDAAVTSSFEKFVPAPELRIGVPRKHFLEELDEATRSSFERLLSMLRNCEGVDVVEMDIDGTEYVLAAQMALLMGEGARTYSDMSDADRELLPGDVRLRLEAGLFVDEETTDSARSFKCDWVAAIDRRLEEFDVLMTPTVATAEPHLSQSEIITGRSSIPTGVILSRLTSPFNLSGHPAVTLPYWETQRRIPLGVQLIGAKEHDRILLAIAKHLEALLPARVAATLP